jgi:hypothetical protein
MIIPGQFGFNCPSDFREEACSNAFFSETTNMIKAKLYMNGHWMVLYKYTFFVRYEIQNGGYGRT